MTRQEKAVSIALLIPIIFGLIIWIETGFFALPFPLLDALFLIAAIYFGWKLARKFPYAVLFSIAFAFTHLLTQPFIWSFFIPEENLNQLSSTGTIDLLKLISGCFYIGWGAISIYRSENKIRIVSFLGFLFSYLAAVIFNSNELFLLSSLLPYFLSFWYRDIQPFHLLWLLLLIFEWMKWLMSFWIVE